MIPASFLDFNSFLCFIFQESIAFYVLYFDKVEIFFIKQMLILKF